MKMLTQPIGEKTTFASWLTEAYGSYEEDRIIFTKNSVEYVVDSKEHPRYITAFKQKEDKAIKVGSMQLEGFPRIFKGKKYTRIGGVDVDKKHRREHIALNMYIAALQALYGAGYGGIMSRDEDVAAKKFVKDTRQRLGAYNPDEDNPGLWLIDARKS